MDYGYEIYKVSIGGTLILRYDDLSTDTIPTDVVVNGKRWWLERVRLKKEELSYYATYKPYED